MVPFLVRYNILIFFLLLKKLLSITRFRYLQIDINLSNYILDMPQLVPFYFIEQVAFAFILLIIIIYVVSKHILPIFARLYSTRTIISKI